MFQILVKFSYIISHVAFKMCKVLDKCVYIKHYMCAMQYLGKTYKCSICI